MQKEEVMADIEIVNIDEDETLTVGTTIVFEDGEEFYPQVTLDPGCTLRIDGHIVVRCAGKLGQTYQENGELKEVEYAS